MYAWYQDWCQTQPDDQDEQEELPNSAAGSCEHSHPSLHPNAPSGNDNSQLQAPASNQDSLQPQAPASLEAKVQAKLHDMEDHLSKKFKEANVIKTKTS